MDYQNGKNLNKSRQNAGEVHIGTHEKGYYRFQEDKQVVLKRDETQQKIFEEYFVVKNYQTTSCDSSLKKKSEMLNLVCKLFLCVGLILFGYYFIKRLTSSGPIIGSESENYTWLLILGIICVITFFICKYLSSRYLKKYNASIKVKVAPRKLMTDEEYEKMVEEKISSMDIDKLSLAKLGLDEEQVKEIKPIIFRDKVITDESLKVRNNDNNSVHSSTQHVTYLYFTDEQLFVYKIQFDMCCNKQNEWTDEFFYKDICDVSTSESRNVLAYGDIKFEYSTMAFKIIATNSEIGFVLEGDKLKMDSIQAMKQKIREKKML